MAIENKTILPFYQALIENSRDVVTLLDENGIVQFQSPSVKVLFGYEPDDLVGSFILDKVHVEDQDRAKEILAQILGGNEPPPFIVRYQHINGSWRFVEVIAHFLDQTLSGVMLNSRDVTEFEETSRARRLADASFEAAFNASSAMNSISIVETGEFFSVNDGWEQALGWSREEAIGKTAEELNIWGGVESRAEVIAEFQKSGELRGRRVELTTKSGNKCIVLLDATYLYLPVGTRLYLSALDITEQEQTEEMLRQSQRLDAIGHLTGGIAHDFNNLLTVIMGHAELAIMDPQCTDQVTESLAAIERVSVTGANLIQQLLSFSRKQSLSPSSTRLSEHLEAMRPLLKTTIAKDIELKINCVRDKWYCLIDTHQLDNAILNITINARDAMPEGGTLEFIVDDRILSETEALKHDLDAGDYLSLQIKDTGIGMSALSTKHAFDPFYTTKQDLGGSGLGLSMVFGFITQSGGRVFIEPSSIGTTISLLLPRALAPTIDPVLLSKTERQRRNKTVLLVEDNVDVRMLVAKQLESLGYQVTEVGTAAEAEALVNPNFDLLVCDLMLPGNRKGPEVGNKFRQRQPDLAVLYISGYQQGILTPEETQSSSVSFIQKPFSKRDFAAKIDELFQNISGRAP